MKKKCLEEYSASVGKVIPNFTKKQARSVLTNDVKIDYFLCGIDKFQEKVARAITNKFIGLYNGCILNHTASKISELDLEMIETVPQGGNWKNIRQEIVQKSQRLQRIVQTGGRTTLYGRIDYNKPSYTITTYFNRPGNGTYVHPIHNRMISVREAARFQMFRDDYYFYGNQRQLLTQVGNAVPTFLAYQIGSEIVKKTGCCKSIDLFCGAGGMTIGFKEAGITSLLSNDIDESACITIKANNPEINVLCGDISKQEIKDVIKKIALEQEVDIICGGPPCQGFSMAGFRAINDPRNQLLRDFVAVAKIVNPKIIIFENVEGLLSHQGGKTYKEILQLFSELGYIAEGRVLSANEYGVPQKRKRVIMICTRNDLATTPDVLFPSPITLEEKKQITAKDTILDLEEVACGDQIRYCSKNVDSDIVDFFRGNISYKKLFDKIHPLL